MQSLIQFLYFIKNKIYILCNKIKKEKTYNLATFSDKIFSFSIILKASSIIICWYKI